MKCQNCGSNLNIEDKFCPNCGTPNPFAKKHQEEMAHFEQEFEKTREEVIEKTAKVNRNAGKITVIAVMIALCAIMSLLTYKADDIYYWRIEKQLNSNSAKITADIEQMMADDEYSLLAEYVNTHKLLWGRSFENYETVYFVSSAFRQFEFEMNQLTCYNDMQYIYDTEGEIIENISRYLMRIYEDSAQDEYADDENFTPEKVAYMNRLIAQAEAMVQNFFGLTGEQTDALSEMTEARITVLLEDSYEQKKEKK